MIYNVGDQHMTVARFIHLCWVYKLSVEIIPERKGVMFRIYNADSSTSYYLSEDELTDDLFEQTLKDKIVEMFGLNAKRPIDIKDKHK